MAEATPAPKPPPQASPRLDPLRVLLYGLLSCGLYYLWWNARVARVLNAAAGRELLSPALASLSALCGPLHLYFWLYAGIRGWFPWSRAL
jgi:hypothetical protein